MAGKRKKDATLRVEEDLTVVNAEALRERFGEALAGDGPLLLDLSDVGEMDTAGFQLLAALKRGAEDAGREFRIAAHSQATLSVLKLYNMEAHFGVDADALGVLGSDGNDEETPPGADGTG